MTLKNFNRANIFWLIVFLFVLVVVVVPTTYSRHTEEIQFSVFREKIEQGLVKDVKFSGQEISGHLADGREFTSTGPQFLEPVYNELLEHGVTPDFEQQSDTNGLLLTATLGMLPVAAMVLVFLWFMRNIQGSNGRAMSFGKSKAKLHSEGARRITFEDVAGIDESKEELEEIIEFLKDPRKFTRLGGRIPKGVLLMGPPGTGKTLLARAVAGEAGVPFFSISGSDFVEMFVGVGASRVRDLFDQGKKHAPCIIFIDEIDAVGRHRGAGLGGGHDEREQTLNQLLVEMDGFEGTEGVILMAATNRPDVLDPALLRPGRFDRRVTVPAPDVRGRQKILEIHTRRVPLSPNVDLDTLAKITPGFSGADLENLCNEAALLAARFNKKQVEMDDFEKAREKIFMGPERKSMVMPEWEKKNTAYHEAGHAIVAHLLPGHDPVHKITIVPRGRALGLTWTMPDEDRISLTREAMYKQIAMLMGGRAAEEVALNSMTGGAANDIERATRMARYMVCELGMSDELGPLTWGDKSEEASFLSGRMGTRIQTYSEQTARRIDVEVKDIVQKAYLVARQILTMNLHVLHRVAQTLVDKETLDREEFSQLVKEAVPLPIEQIEGIGWMGVTST
jgi:cell division protease FtsH